MWLGLARLRLPRSRGKRAEERLLTAYETVFDPHSVEAQLVLADLANHCGFFRASGPGLSADERSHAEGMRAAFARLYGFLRLTDEQRQALQQAAREEARADGEG